MNDAKREKSNMELWAEEEIRIACKRERGNTSENEGLWRGLLRKCAKGVQILGGGWNIAG